MKNKLYKLFLGFVALLQMPCFAADTTDATFYQDTFGWTKLHRTVAFYKFDKDRFWEDQEDQENAYAEEFKKSLPVSLPQQTVNTPDKAGRTPLHLAIMCGNQAAIKVLKDTGKADENARDFFGLTPADYAKEAHDVHPSKDQNYIDLLMLFAPFVFSSEALADRFFDDGKNIIIKKKHPDQQEQLIKYFIDEQLKSEEKIDFTKHGLTPENVYSLLAAPELLIANTREQIVPLLNQAKPFTSYIKTVEVAHEFALIQIDTECKKIIQVYKKDSSQETKQALLKRLTSFYKKFKDALIDPETPELFFSVIIEAIKLDWIDAVCFLLSKNPEFTTFIDKKTKKNLLHYAAEAGRFEILYFLIKTKLFDLNAQDEAGNTALHYATTSNNLDAVKLLYDSGANVNIWNNDGLNPILYCRKYCKLKNKTNATILIRNFLYLTESDIDYSRDHCKVYFSDPENVIVDKIFKSTKEILFSNAYEIPSHQMRLYFLIKKGSREVVDKFLTYCIKNGYTYEELNCYSSALEKGYIDLAFIWARRNDPWILFDFCKYGDLNAVKKCVEEYNCPIHQRRRFISDDTPLYFAAKLGKADIVEYFISKGAPTNVLDKNIETPYDVIGKDNKNIDSESTKKLKTLLKPSYWSRISQFIRCHSSKDDGINLGLGDGVYVNNEIMTFFDFIQDYIPGGKNLFRISGNLFLFTIFYGCLGSVAFLTKTLQGKTIYSDPFAKTLATFSGSSFLIESLYSFFKSSLTYHMGPINIPLDSHNDISFRTKPFYKSEYVRYGSTDDIKSFFLSLYRTLKVGTLATCAASLPTKYAAILWPITAFEALKLWYMTPCVDWSYQDWKQKLFGSKLRTALTLGAGTLVTAAATALLAKRYPAVLSTLQSTGKFVSSALPKLWGNRHCRLHGFDTIRSC